MFQIRRNLLAMLPFLALGCSGSSGASVRGVPSASLPEYSGSEALLFDDSIAGDTVEAGFGSPDLAKRQLISERSKRSELIVPARVATVSALGRSFEVTFEPVGAPLRGEPLGSALTLTVSPRMPAFAFLESHSSQLSRSNVILFLKRYSVDESIEIHFRIEPDNPPMRQAIERALALMALGS